MESSKDSIINCLPIYSRLMLDEKSYFGYYLNLIPQGLTGVNTWVTWTLFLSFFIGVCNYVEACLADFEANITVIGRLHSKGVIDRKTRQLLNDTLDLHAELTK